jgi:hypothetical protein
VNRERIALSAFRRPGETFGRAPTSAMRLAYPMRTCVNHPFSRVA